MAEDVLSNLVFALASGGVRVVDLSAPLGPDTPVIDLPGQFAASPSVTIQTLSRYDEKGPAWYWNSIACGEHTGTHFDAPVHWVTGRELPNNTTDTIPAHHFVAPACVVDCSRDAADCPDFLLTRDLVLAWEAEHGQIPAGSWLLLRTDWSLRSGRDAFLNIAADGPHSPGFHPDCVSLLAHERSVLGLGVETVGTDAGQAGTFEVPFPAHTIMQGSGRFGLASLTNLAALPPVGSVLIAAPLKIVKGSGSPLRVLALVPVSAANLTP